MALLGLPIQGPASVTVEEIRKEREALIVTEIGRDGTLEGPDIDGLGEVLDAPLAIYSRAKAGDFADKVEWYRAEYDAELASATLRWGPTGNDQPPTNRFGMRLSR